MPARTRGSYGIEVGYTGQCGFGPIRWAQAATRLCLWPLMRSGGCRYVAMIGPQDGSGLLPSGSTALRVSIQVSTAWIAAATDQPQASSRLTSAYCCRGPERGGPPPEVCLGWSAGAAAGPAAEARFVRWRHQLSSRRRCDQRFPSLSGVSRLSWKPHAPYRLFQDSQRRVARVLGVAIGASYTERFCPILSRPSCIASPFKLVAPATSMLSANHRTESTTESRTTVLERSWKDLSSGRKIRE